MPRWIRQLLNAWELYRYKPPCRECLLLTACTVKNKDCKELDMAVINYMLNKYPNFCAYCGGRIYRTGETEWFRGCEPPMLSSVYKCDTCTFDFLVGSV